MYDGVAMKDEPEIQDARLNLRLTTRLYGDLARLAKADRNRKLAEYVRLALEEHVARSKPKARGA